MTNINKLEQKLGEVLGLEMAAQKAVEELSTKGLLDEAGVKNQIEGMKQEANNHQKKIDQLIDTLSKSEGLDSQSVQESAKETQQKASQMMHIYLGEDPDSSEGGWVLGGFDTHERLVREIAIGAHAAVVFVNYTPSPEAKYPAPLEQAYAATKWVSENGQTINVNSSHLAVVGDSVGGNMAAAVSLLAKDRGGPKIKYQVLFYPVTDANFDTPSYTAYQDGYFLTREAMKWFWDNYNSNQTNRKEPTVSPLQDSIEQLRGLPPALIINGEFDVLRDEGEAYAHKLIEAGVPVTGLRYHGTIHDFVMLNPLADTPATRGAIEQASQMLNRILWE
jgi:acetyl esterase